MVLKLYFWKVVEFILVVIVSRVFPVSSCGLNIRFALSPMRYASPVTVFPYSSEVMQARTS